MIAWHNLLGITLTDFYHGTSFRVDLEKEIKYPQYIDIVVVENKQADQLESQLESQPDGLENLAKYNLITYKSLWEPLDSWTIDELISYYVLLRKVTSLESKNLIPVSEFNLIGIATRFPQKLNNFENLEYIKEGVYNIFRGENVITIIVTSQTPKTLKNTIWQMFSGIPEQIIFGLKNYNWKRKDYKYIVSGQLHQKYKSKGLIMPYTEQDFFRDSFNYFISNTSIEDVLKKFSPEEVFKNYTPEERLKGLKFEDVFKNYKPEDIVKYFPKEELKKCLGIE